jgi:enoyl-CoA hydratase
MNFQTIQTSIKDKIAHIRLNRPDALNALNTSLFNEINLFLEENPPGKSYGVLIISGNGKAFAAGADIAEMVDKTAEQAEVYSKLGQDTFSRIEESVIPVIASVNGYALGGGCELCMSAHIRIASSKARFGQPEVNLGLIPGFAATQRLPRLVGLSNALYLLFTTDMIGAEEALRMGLVQKVVEHDLLEEETTKVAKIILQKGPEAIKKVIEVTRKTQGMSVKEGSGYETKAFGSLFGGEGTEGMRAFLEKRDPSW